MIDNETLARILEASAIRREERRSFLRIAGASTVAIAGVSLLSACGDDDDETPTPAPPPAPTPPPTPTPPPPPTDEQILNFALNLEYLEAQFYFYAAFGAGLPADLQTGTGAQGAATGGRQVAFTDPQVARYAREIATDERAHVAFIRAALGAAAVAQPAIDISADPNGGFSTAARAAGLIGAGASFDPYANDENFLLAAFIFEDVGVTAYKGAAPLITSPVFLEAAAGILAAEAYHAGLIRTVLYRKGVEGAAALIDATEAISTARDNLDGPTDLDQGIRPIGNASNIVPTDGNAIAFSRTPQQVLNIAYLRTTVGTGGGFFPAGVNGALRSSGGTA